MSTETQPAEAPALGEPKPITKPTKFKDLDGREWPIVLKSSTLERLKQAHQVDLWDASNLTESGPLVKLADERKLLAVLWELVEVQAEAESITKAQFEDAVAGDVFDDAFEAIQGALFVFFSGARRSILQVTLKELEGLASKKLQFIQELQEASKAKEREVLEEAKKQFLAKVTGTAKANVSKLLASIHSA